MKPSNPSRRESILYDIYHLGNQKSHNDLGKRVRKGASLRAADKAHMKGNGGMARLGETRGARRIKGQ